MGKKQSTLETMDRVKGRVNPDFWKNKKVFLTGHTGFKGSWMSLLLQSLGAIVKGYSLAPPTKPSLFIEANVGEGMISEIGNINDLATLKASMTEFNPDILLHMAAQPLVRLSYKEPIETYMTNVIGTANVLESARFCSNLKAIVSVTTDKCYENKEWDWGYRENEPMGGHDPYSSSKGCAELVTAAYRKSYFNTNDTANVASARAGNVIGGGDWAEDRLIPDILRAFQKKEPVVIRNPLSTRPWQHVLEPISGYLVLAEALASNKGHEFAEGWNFGPLDEDAKPVNWILDVMVAKWGEGVSWKLDKNNNPHEAGFLKLDISKAKNRLKWEPKWKLEETINSIIDWQQRQPKDSARDLCLEQINEFLNK